MKAPVKTSKLFRAPRPSVAGSSGVDTVASTPSSRALYSSPEFLFRRAHQIAAAAFAEACRHLDLTPSQYSVLFMLRETSDVSQNELARRVSLDRSTISIVLRSLLERRLVREQPDPDDRRKKRLWLSDSGRLLLAEAERLSADSSQQLMAALGTEKATMLLSLLEEFSTSPRFDISV